MQSFCHTAAYPKPVDVKTHRELPAFISTRGGVALRPGDGVIHSWLNRLLLPDTVGTGGDSHTRFPIGISFPAGSGLVAFAAATGVMPLDMPESVLVRFKGEMQPGVTLRDLVHAIPLYAIKAGLLTVAKAGKVNAFSGRILEIEGLPDLKVEQAFELSDASAERSAAGCTIKLNQEPDHRVPDQQHRADEEHDRRRLPGPAHPGAPHQGGRGLAGQPATARSRPGCRIRRGHRDRPGRHQGAHPLLPERPGRRQAAVSEVAGTKIDEVFIGSCMTNIGHFRAAAKLLGGQRDIPVKLWVAPPTKMDESELIKEGHYNTFGVAGARTEMPGCSLCMGNQAQVREGATVVSTSTRNFPNRLGKNSQRVPGLGRTGGHRLQAGPDSDGGRVPGRDGHHRPDKASVYRYLNFDQIEEYAQTAKGVAV